MEHPCHWGNRPVFKVGATLFLGGGQLYGMQPAQVDHVVSLVHGPYLTPGGGAPRFDWPVVVQDLCRYQKVLVYCVGGHGRTGTFLGALAVTAGLVPVQADPVAWVRKRLCVMAVETKVQAKYLRSLHWEYWKGEKEHNGTAQ